ncbi:hypothetical protein, partial [Nitrincola nitratireducens]|uniref:hypothetical protein n=1 Tax=Nitrincola nitratireducens TaxID=1229521 RepID=UPI00055BEAF4
GTATAFPLRLRLHYKAARAGGAKYVGIDCAKEIFTIFGNDYPSLAFSWGINCRGNESRL